LNGVADYLPPNHSEAFKSYRKTSPLDAARTLSAAIEIYTANGNFRRAATNMQTLGELYELEVGDPAKALQSYETAANWYSDDNAEALANKLLLKVGELGAEQGDYYKYVRRCLRS
jgi:alpha-soluble NSF attachment protein